MITLNKKRKYIIYSLLGIITITLATISTINRVKKISTPPDSYLLTQGKLNIKTYSEYYSLAEKYINEDMYLESDSHNFHLDENGDFIVGDANFFSKNNDIRYSFRFYEDKFELLEYPVDFNRDNSTYLSYNYVFEKVILGYNLFPKNKKTIISFESRKYYKVKNYIDADTYIFKDNNLVKFDENLINKENKYFFVDYYNYILGESLGCPVIELFCEI